MNTLKCNRGALFPAFSKRWIPVLTGLALFISGCSNPVGIKPVSVQTAYRIHTESALSADEPSEPSKMVLRRLGLLDRFDKEPEAVLAELHRGLKQTDDDDRLFSLAELSFLHGQDKHDQAYFLASAVYAWALLFPGEGAKTSVLPSDPRFRLAYDLYNQAVAKGLAVPGQGDEVRPVSGTFKLPFGSLEIVLDESGLTWGGYKLDHFVPTTTLDVHGFRNRYRVPGLGAPLSAGLAAGEASANIPGAKRLSAGMKVPVTALLRFDQARANLAQGRINGRLELHATGQVPNVTVDGQEQPLESDTTAVLADQLNDSPLYSLEFAAFLNGSITNVLPKDRAQDGLLMMQPYQPGKIPVVLVHGTASSPVRWAELFNELEGDPRIRGRFQFWAFLYDSGNPIPYSAGRLRKALTTTLQEFDPESRDPELHHMVVIGHSQGGLLTKLTAIDTGTRLWDRISSKSFDEIQVSPETHELLKQSLFFTPLPFVQRLVFVATPHHGAIMAAWQWVTDLASRVVIIPVTIMSGLAQLAATSSGDEKLNAVLRKPPTSIDNMNPSNPGLQIIASTPVSSQIPVHSIIAVEGDGPKEEGNDGVVAYKSAHIDEAVSELVVRSGHSCQGRPETIEEIRRILLEHAAVPVAAHH